MFREAKDREQASISEGFATEPMRRVSVRRTQRASSFVQFAQLADRFGVFLFRRDEQEHPRLQAVLWHTIAVEVSLGESNGCSRIARLHGGPESFGCGRFFLDVLAG